eukprot:CAMPEP_0173378690 /NCGR_PEP_ID=MMETSP1356-20130122/1814_1 /TAXON_ID=77927 ORGANISM="Hemiselmis virescens, Strain PCC157" /NCGR_SAMPLE_ID=MMETSP1356 /ASSEMBLY_ACC=CAM_ASM_000847 /LENGTH=325 /DNA_ID=CAMNT_0014331837 /DNA_START=80 /DNA_END=1057 /DNA_ORIENTATION=-
MCVSRMHTMGHSGMVGEVQAQQAATAAVFTAHPAKKMSRIEAMPGLPNLRRLREGSPIMRAACPTSADAAEQEAIRSKLGVRSLVDLRTADERLGDPLPYPMWDSVVRVRQGTVHSPPVEEASPQDTIEEGVVLYNVPLYTTRRIMRWVLLNAPLWEKPQLLSSLPTVLGLAKPDPDTMQVYNSSLSRHGLKGHNSFLLSSCGPQVCAVLQLMCDQSNLPMVFFCSLGKDRTGVISMLALHCGGASRDQIREDFKRSAEGLAKVKADVMQSLEKKGLDPEEFISARAEIVDEAFEYLDAKYGGVDEYLDSIGFGAEWRDKLAQVI